MKKYLVIAAMFAASNALSVSKCAAPESQATATECSCLNNSAEDKRLNAVYKLAMARLLVSERANLRNSQRMWLKARDQRCMEPLGPPELAGSMWRMELCDCLARESQKRSAFLQALRPEVSRPNSN